MSRISSTETLGNPSCCVSAPYRAFCRSSFTPTYPYLGSGIMFRRYASMPRHLSSFLYCFSFLFLFFLFFPSVL